MPGFTGIIRSSPDPKTEEELDAMVSVMRHEGHYSSGRFVEENCGLWIGWVSHVDSFSDGMPLISHDRNTILIFAGEDFQEPEVVARLPEASPDNHASKAAYLLSLYHELGDSFFEKLNGWFAGVVVNRLNRTVSLFNDRYGMGRMYFHVGSDEFLFGSEAKSLLKVRPALRGIRPEGLAQYLRYNCVLNDETIFPGVSVLPRASVWSFEAGRSKRKTRYFDFPQWEEQTALGVDEFYDKWSSTVSQVFPRYAQEGAQVALSSTAGLDTRVIMAALRERNAVHPSYTFGGAWGELFDVSTSRKTASVYGQDHRCISINSDFLNNFGDFAHRAVYLSDGTHDAFGAHDVFFNQVAHAIAPIRLTGKFGSEIVRIRKLVPSVDYDAGFLSPELQELIDQLPPFADVFPNRHPLTRVIGEEIPWHEYPRVSVEQSQLVLRSPYMDNELVRLMYRAPAECRGAGDLQERYVKHVAPEFAQFITNLGRFSSDSPLVTKLSYYAFWALFKVEYIYLYATPHWFTRLDQAFGSLHMERILSGRQKWEGYRLWIKSHFADFIQDTLGKKRASYTDFFEGNVVKQMVADHIAGTHNYLEEINRALTTELIFTSLIED